MIVNFCFSFQGTSNAKFGEIALSSDAGTCTLIFKKFLGACTTVTGETNTLSERFLEEE